MTQPPYRLTGFSHGLSGIEALVTLEGEAVTVITGLAPYDAVPARTWSAHGQFLTWAERQYGTVDAAVLPLVEERRRR